MKDKGFLILIIVAAGFVYFVFNFVSNVQDEKLNKTTDYYNVGTNGDDTQKAISKYYTQDVTGSEILDLSGVPLEQAKEIWRKSPTKGRILRLFPNFKLMKDMINLRLAPSDFRDYLLQKVDDVESEYLSGSITSYNAKRMLSELKD